MALNVQRAMAAKARPLSRQGFCEPAGAWKVLGRVAKAGDERDPSCRMQPPGSPNPQVMSSPPGRTKRGLSCQKGVSRDGHFRKDAGLCCGPRLRKGEVFASVGRNRNLTDLSSATGLICFVAFFFPPFFLLVLFFPDAEGTKRQPQTYLNNDPEKVPAA